MKKLTIIKPPAIQNIEVEIVNSIYNPENQCYITTNKDWDLIWLEQQIQEKNREIAYYKKRYDNMLNGLSYWKSKYYSVLD